MKTDIEILKERVAFLEKTLFTTLFRLRMNQGNCYRTFDDTIDFDYEYRTIKDRIDALEDHQ